MPAPCVTCADPRREEIDAALVLGQDSLRALAARYGHDRSSLKRHADRHLSAALITVAADRETAGAITALDTVEQRVDELTRRLGAFLDDAEASGKAAQFLGASRELRASLELLAKLRHELDERARVDVTVNLDTDPTFLRYCAAIADAVRPFPEARQAVAETLRGLRLAELEAAS